MQSCVKAREEPAQRQYHEPRGEVPGGVHGVEGEPRDYPGYSPLPAEAEGQRLPGRVERAVGQPVQGADGGIDYHRGPGRHIPRQEHRHAPEQRPYVQMRRPPDGEAPCEALEQGVDVDGIERLRAVYQGQQHREHPQEVNVWQHRHYLLGGVHQRAEHGEGRHLPDAQLTLKRPRGQGRIRLRRPRAWRLLPWRRTRRLCRAPSNIRRPHSPRKCR